MEGKSLDTVDHQIKRNEIIKKIKNKTENKEKSKCFTCVWGDKEARFCMFPSCIYEEKGEKKDE